MSAVAHYRYTFRAMACDNTIELWAPDRASADAAAEAAMNEVWRIEAKYSRYRPESVVSTINRAAGEAAVEVDAETAKLLAYAEMCFRQSDGLFDVTSGVLRRAWDFKAGRPPERAEVEPLLPLIGWTNVERTRHADGSATVRLPQVGMEVDFGGIGKEYAADRAAACLLAQGVRSGFVDLGGDVVVTGPHPDGTPWQLGIRHPRDPEAVVARVPLMAGAVATSGDYERYFDWQGRRFSHLLNPRTGEPVQGLQSVTVFAPSCLVAGSLSTIGMLRGGESGLTWLEHSGAAFLAVAANGEVVDALDRLEGGRQAGA